MASIRGSADPISGRRTSFGPGHTVAAQSAIEALIVVEQWPGDTRVMPVTSVRPPARQSFGDVKNEGTSFYKENV